MEKIKSIVSVLFNLDVLAQPQGGTNDHLGTIAEFNLSHVHEPDYHARQSLKFLVNCFKTLGYYRNSQTVPDMFGEMADCWVEWDDEYKVRVIHKYWTHAQVSAFQGFLMGSAKLHGWDYEERNFFSPKGDPLPDDQLARWQLEIRMIDENAEFFLDGKFRSCLDHDVIQDIISLHS